MPPADLRAEFPVLERMAYMNAGTDGPVPRYAAERAAERAQWELEHGRAGPEHRGSLDRMREDVRERLAARLGCETAEVALTHSTTDGVNTVVSGVAIGRGDEILTSTEEHPGLLAPLALAAQRTGARIRTVSFDEIAGEVRARTRLVACSHVSWVTGRVVEGPALAQSGVPVLLDGAQGLGAIPVDVRALGCDFYAAAGQKWLCGPDGSGCLFVAAERCESIVPSSPGYDSLADPGGPLELALHPGARRFDRGAGSGPLAAFSLASLEVLERAGWDDVLSRGPTLAARLSGRLAEERIVVRDIPGHGLVRASVGAWSNEEEVDAVAAAAAG